MLLLPKYSFSHFVHSTSFVFNFLLTRVYMPFLRITFDNTKLIAIFFNRFDFKRGHG